jgi:putative acetyltransferase
VAVRPEAPADAAAIFDLYARAFPSDAEARIVDALRAAGAVRVSLVAERTTPRRERLAADPGRPGRAADGPTLVGHVLLSEVEVRDPPVVWSALGLGPMAVAPDVQRCGIGGALVRAALDRARAAGQPVVFVLGHPDYYPRLGFEPAAPRGLHYAGGPAFAPAFFVTELAPGTLGGRRGTVHYHAAFGTG